MASTGINFFLRITILSINPLTESYCHTTQLLFLLSHYDPLAAIFVVAKSRLPTISLSTSLINCLVPHPSYRTILYLLLKIHN
jgi:hypothetical protein